MIFDTSRFERMYRTSKAIRLLWCYGASEYTVFNQYSGHIQEFWLDLYFAYNTKQGVFNEGAD